MTAIESTPCLPSGPSAYVSYSNAIREPSGDHRGNIKGENRSEGTVTSGSAKTPGVSGFPKCSSPKPQISRPVEPGKLAVAGAGPLRRTRVATTKKSTTRRKGSQSPRRAGRHRGSPMPEHSLVDTTMQPADSARARRRAGSRCFAARPDRRAPAPVQRVRADGAATAPGPLHARHRAAPARAWP